jgi:DNA polymerase-4
VATIFHLDMDAFFVSVEELFDPSLKGRAVVVGGRPDERGVVAAASYEARKFGVHSAMPLRRAARLCPHAVFLEGHPERYRAVSEEVFRILQAFSPKVEMASIDEAYLDMTGTERLSGPPMRAAHALHQAIKRRIGLNCSIGVAASRLVAKVASDLAKPNGILWVLPGAEARFLAPLEVRRIPGVGKATEQALRRLGVRKVGELARLDESLLAARLGKWGLALADKARGLDAGGWYDAEIGKPEAPKSISHEHTFGHDTEDAAVLEATLARLTEMVGRRLREHALYARTVAIKLRYGDFSTFTRARTLAHGTCVDAELLVEVRVLFRRNWNGKRVRLLGVAVSSLAPAPGQLGLLQADQRRRWEQALAAVDRVRDKFGESSVSLAASLGGAFRERAHENPAGLPGKGARRKRD